MAPLNVLTANKEDIVKYFAAAIMPTAQHMVDTVGKLGDELDLINNEYSYLVGISHARVLEAPVVFRVLPHHNIENNQMRGEFRYPLFGVNLDSVDDISELEMTKQMAIFAVKKRVFDAGDLVILEHVNSTDDHVRGYRIPAGVIEPYRFGRYRAEDVVSNLGQLLPYDDFHIDVTKSSLDLFITFGQQLLYYLLKLEPDRYHPKIIEETVMGDLAEAAHSTAKWWDVSDLRQLQQHGGKLSAQGRRSVVFPAMYMVHSDGDIVKLSNATAPGAQRESWMSPVRIPQDCSEPWKSAGHAMVRLYVRWETVKYKGVHHYVGNLRIKVAEKKDGQWDYANAEDLPASGVTGTHNGEWVRDLATMPQRLNEYIRDQIVAGKIPPPRISLTVTNVCLPSQKERLKILAEREQAEKAAGVVV